MFWFTGALVDEHMHRLLEEAEHERLIRQVRRAPRRGTLAQSLAGWLR